MFCLRPVRYRGFSFLPGRRGRGLSRIGRSGHGAVRSPSCLVRPRAVEGPCPQALPGLSPNSFCSPDDSLWCFPAQRLLLQELFQYPRFAGGRCLPHLHGNRVSTSTLRRVGTGLFSLAGQLGCCSSLCWIEQEQPAHGLDISPCVSVHEVMLRGTGHGQLGGREANFLSVKREDLGRNSTWSCFLQLPVSLGLMWGGGLVIYACLCHPLRLTPWSRPGLHGCLVGLCQAGLGRGTAPSQLYLPPQVQCHLSGEDSPGAEGTEASASH